MLIGRAIPGGWLLHLTVALAVSPHAAAAALPLRAGENPSVLLVYAGLVVLLGFLRHRAQRA
jgi:hypothetical protein